MKTSRLIKWKTIRNRLSMVAFMGPFLALSLVGFLGYAYLIIWDEVTVFEVIGCIVGLLFSWWFMKMLITEFTDERIKKMVPYFSKRVGSKAETFSSGFSLAMHIDLVDQRLESLGARTISSFGYADSVRTDDGRWHEVSDVRTSIAHLLEWGELPEEVRTELIKIDNAAEVAASVGAKIRFHIRGSDKLISLYEMDIRKGSYF